MTSPKICNMPSLETNDESKRDAAALTADRLGFAWRQRGRCRASDAWHKTVTHYHPEAWLVAVEHEQMRLRVKLRVLPEANR